MEQPRELIGVPMKPPTAVSAAESLHASTASGINNAISRIAGMLAIDAATNTAVRADREARFFTICSSYAPILNPRREISR